MEVRRLKPDELQHHGIKGQKWGVRRYQNPDGSLTAAGRARYLKEFITDFQANNNKIENTKVYKEVKEGISKETRNEINKVSNAEKELDKKIWEYRDEFSNDPKKALEYTKQAVEAAYGYSKKDRKTEDFKNDVWFYYNEDGDNGATGSAWDYFLQSKGTSYQKINTKAQEYRRDKEYLFEKATKEIIGQIGDETIKPFKASENNPKKNEIETTINKLISRSLTDNTYDDSWGSVRTEGANKPGIYDEKHDVVIWKGKTYPSRDTFVDHIVTNNSTKNLIENPSIIYKKDNKK